MEREGLCLTPFSIEPVDSAGAQWELRRFVNVIVAKDLTDSVRIKAMMLHYAGEAEFKLRDAVAVITDDGFA